LTGSGFRSTLQSTLTLFDLLFLAVFLATLIALIVGAYQSVRGRIAQAGKVLLGVIVFWAIYLCIVAAVSLSTPRRVVAIGEDRCFDDWCIAVEKVTGTGSIAVTLRVSSVAKRIRQSAPDTTVYLEDAEGKRYVSKPATGQPSFGTMIGPGESFVTVREFDVPSGARELGLVVKHGSTGPGAIVIGDDAAMFHKPAIVKIQ
jgi:hypothetical protein